MAWPSATWIRQSQEEADSDVAMILNALRALGPGVDGGGGRRV
jgi:hypothetical protein